MPTHTGGNDRSAQGVYRKNQTETGKLDNSRVTSQASFERAERRERRARLSEKSQLEQLNFKKHLKGNDAEAGTVPARVIKSH